jgi:hypothetical protein
MQENSIMSKQFNAANTDAADAYGIADAAVRTAQKRNATDAALAMPPTKAMANTVRVMLEDDDEEPSKTTSSTATTSSTTSTVATRARTVTEAAESVIDTKFDWRNLTTPERIAQVCKVADSLSKAGDYLNINPLSANYTALYNQAVECGWNFQFQTPPMVSTTGLRNSEKFPGQWSALLAGNENMELMTRLGQSPEVANHMVFLRALLNYLNRHLIEHGEEIFLNTAKRVEDENAKAQQKNSKQQLANPYKQVTFVTRGKHDESFGELWKTGKYTQAKYEAEVQPLIGTFFVAYEDNEPSVQVRAYPKNTNGVRNNDVPDVVILNENGDVETFDPQAPYCQGGRTSWEALLKVSIKWYDGQFRMYLNMKAFRYYLNGSGGGGSAAQQIVFSDADGSKRRVVVDSDGNTRRQD